jgi:hypothetical protein
MTAGMDRQVCAFVLAVGIAGGVACSSPAPTGPRPQTWPDAAEPGSGSGTGTAAGGVRGVAVNREETHTPGHIGE